MSKAVYVLGRGFVDGDMDIDIFKTKPGAVGALHKVLEGAVRAWHVGDEEYQMIFPLCSEYNVIPLIEPRPGDIQVETEGGEAATFKTLEDVIAYAERDEKRAVQANPSRRLVRL